jgi:transcriptional regulator EpsA
MQNEILSAGEKLGLLSVLEKLFLVDEVDRFLDWVDCDLGAVFPHKIFCCGVVDTRERPVVVQRLVYRNFPAAFFDDCRQQDGRITTPCMCNWAKTGEPQLFDLEHDAHCDPASVQRFRRFKLRNVAAHGAWSTDGEDASYFTFVNIPGILGPRHAYFLKLIVPHMHDALLRSVNKDIRPDECDDPAVPEVTKREQEILRWLVSGKSNGEIAQILGTSPHTVKNQMRKLFTKLRVHNRAQAASMAVRLRI